MSDKSFVWINCFLFPVNHKLFVGNGHGAHASEVLSLPSDLFPTICSTNNSELNSIYSTIGAEILGRATLCVQSFKYKNCSYYEPIFNKWYKFPSLLTARSHASSLRFLVNGHEVWWVLGGRNITNFLSSTELFNSSTYSWSSESPTMKIKAAGHCTVQIGYMDIMVVGGYGLNGELSDTYISHWKDMNWEKVNWTQVILNYILPV